MTIATGERLGPYELLAPLGAGGMGVVWRARDERLGREVAVKFLSSALAGDADAIRRFEREARAAAALSHPGIVALFDVGHHEGSPYLVTELLKGETLRERLGRGPLPSSTALALGRELAEALAAAHAEGIVHRDLKPENVFLPGHGHAKLLDFGLASLAERGEPGKTATALTGTGMVMGTVGYLAPEQLRGERVGPAADLFGLGCVLYECCAGSSPFRRGSIAATLHAIANEAAPSLEGLPAIPQPLAGAIGRCLGKRPEDRPTATELASLLAADGSGAAAPTMVLTAERRQPRRRVALALATAVTAVALAVALVVFRSGREERTRQAPAVPASRSELPAAAPAPTGGRGTTDDEAWRLFVRARHAWEQRGGAMEEARDLYKAAVDRDPNFARAWLGLADTYAILHDYAPVPASENFPKAKAAALRALELDPGLGGAHTVLGYVAHKFERDSRAAEREFEAALAWNPNDAKTLQWYAETLASIGRADEAIERIRAARAADPLAPMVAATEVWLLMVVGRPAEALEVAERARDFASFRPLQAYRALALILLGRPAEAASELEPIARANVSPVIELWYAYALAKIGDAAGADTQLEASVSAHDERDQIRYYRAYALLALGRESAALDELERSIEAREEQVAWMKIDPHLAPLRGEPRFAELLRSAGFEP